MWWDFQPWRASNVNLCKRKDRQTRQWSLRWFSGGKCEQDANTNWPIGMENLQQLIRMEGQRHRSNLEERWSVLKARRAWEFLRPEDCNFQIRLSFSFFYQLQLNSNFSHQLFWSEIKEHCTFCRHLRLVYCSVIQLNQETRKNCFKKPHCACHEMQNNTYKKWMFLNCFITYAIS